MATAQLGPELPSPLAAISERYLSRSRLPHVPEYEKFSFGPKYEERMAELVHKHLELNTNDRLCYVGESRGSLAPYLERRFCLLQPVQCVSPGHIHYEETPNQRMMNIKVAHVGCEEFFRNASVSSGPGSGLFDKILITDAIRFLHNTKQTFENMLRTLSDHGKLVIVHRATEMLTLPLFSNAKERMLENDVAYMKIITDLQGLGLDVQWEIECLPVVLPKKVWYSMMNEKFPSQLETVSGAEVRQGLRELSEGILKYGDERIEFQDRLLFISASRNVFNTYPSIHRFSGSRYTPFPGMQDLKYQVQLPKEHKPIEQKLGASQPTASRHWSNWDHKSDNFGYNRKGFRRYMDSL